MGGGPAPPPRYHRRYFINGQAGSRKMDGSGNRTGYNGVKNKHAYGYLTGRKDHISKTLHRTLVTV